MLDDVPAETPKRPGLRGGRVADPGSFPDEQEAYRNMTPEERIAALRALSRRVYAIAEQNNNGRRGHPRLPDRLVGGRR